ncbi:MAG: LysE family translocator [Thiohalomonadaceae bacterium]
MSIEILFLFIVTTAMACFTPGPAAMFVASVGTAREMRLVAHAISGIALANAFYFGRSARRVFGRALVLELSNPKALLYFAALLPQCITPQAPLVMQFLGFCLITVVLDVCAYGFYGAIGFGVARFSAPGGWCRSAVSPGRRSCWWVRWPRVSVMRCGTACCRT